MRILLLFAAVFVAVNASLSVNEKWSKFKVQHDKHYSLVEDKVRFQIYQNNLRKIEEHNKKYEEGEESYFLKETKFADWSEKEFKAMLNFKANNVSSYEKLKLDADYVRPSSVDWRQKGAVGPVKDQSTCGGCWAFSTTGTLEGQLRIHNKNEVLLSEQELLDCDTNNDECNGGDMGFALIYVKKHGLSSEEQYPYIRKQGQCKNVNNKALKSISGLSYLEKTEEALADGIATIGPISVGIAINNNFQLYGGGVFSGKCGEVPNHAVLGVGYADGYWIIKNSWGPNWGEDGFIRMKRGVKLCLIGDYQVYPKL